MHFLIFLPLVLLSLTTASPTILPRTIPTYLGVTNFIRNCSVVDTCDYHFTIDYSPYGTAPCTVHQVKSDPNVKIESQQFFGVGCIENPSTWEVSWGWNYAQDFTVMTVVNKPNNYRAFFGYSHPNVGLPVVGYVDEKMPTQPN